MLYKTTFVAIVYLFLNCELFIDFFLKKIDGAVDIDGVITNKGEVIRFVVFILMFVAIEALVDAA